ncbi:CapA family protein [Sinorhizobium medicae]|uniref:CapA family protein n=1 Tax=Sinorhizobium medicae TaxID=110321 RepID=UPI000419943A|nr:CapA family protein [Sinorhizobium medicae]
MRHRLPSTFIDILRPPTIGYWLKMGAIHWAARVFGFWRKPWPRATEDPEEYTFLDEAYSNYKYLKPILKPEKAVDVALSERDKSIMKLPPEFEKTASLTIGAAGDLMPAEGLEASKDIVFENVADVLLNVDVSFANLEAPVTEQQIKVSFTGDAAPIMGFSPSEFAAIAGHKGLNFKLLSFANNHAFDRGVEGLDTTDRIFAQYGIVPIGTPRTPSEYGRATVISTQGIKIGFVSATFSLNGLKPPVDAAHRVHVSRLSSRDDSPDLGLLNKQIADAKAQNCDFIVASLHWGYEAEFFPRKRQIDVAHALVEEGVDLIIGHHPHVVQPVEYYCTKRDPRRVAVIAYSLGGLGYRWYTAPHFSLGLILNMKLAKGKIDGRELTYIEAVNSVPVFQNIFLSYFGDMKIKRIEKLEDHLKEGEPSALQSYASEIRSYADLVCQFR